MAEGLFRKKAEQRCLDVECSSAGIMTYNGLPASENAVKAMDELGIDISVHKSADIRSLNPYDFDLFVPMTLSHAHALLRLGVEKNEIYVFESDVSDPYGGSLEVYRETRNEIDEKLEKLADFVENKLNAVKNSSDENKAADNRQMNQNSAESEKTENE